ncbi:unnamed protein product [Rhizoctonia solani]|uniref:Uncharacterized protein n=1 Tax=Rhizoctonia solani TaxID=456999 RepID=A0A8H3HA53_9AGAM|nr:unnamed protein product [Rhizoctonia solani]
MSSSTFTSTSPRRFQYEAITGLFVQSEPPTTLNLSRRLNLPAFGLKEHASPTRWRDLKGYVDLLRRSAPENTRYIVCWLARHGQAWHNMGVNASPENASIPEWDSQTADPPLTRLGERQSKALNNLWKAELGRNGDPIPLPTKLFCSPLSRALATMELTFGEFLLGDPNTRAPGERPLVLEGLREFLSPFPHDKRSSKSEILHSFPGVQIEGSFTEEDELWDDTAHESDSQLEARVLSTLDHIFGHCIESTDTGM